MWLLQAPRFRFDPGDDRWRGPAYAGCLWAARLSAASTNGATGAAQAASNGGLSRNGRHDAGRVAPRAQGLTPGPHATGLSRAYKGGLAALGPRYPRPGEVARTCDACRGLIPPNFSESLNIDVSDKNPE